MLEGHTRTGDLMPVLAHLGPAAPCGLASYESGIVAGYQNNLFACQFRNIAAINGWLLPGGFIKKAEDIDVAASRIWKKGPA